VSTTKILERVSRKVNNGNAEMRRNDDHIQSAKSWRKIPASRTGFMIGRDFDLDLNIDSSGRKKEDEREWWSVPYMSSREPDLSRTKHRTIDS
jgi:hypothetical protein